MGRGVIPVQDVVPTGQTPIVTIALIAINAIVFAAQLTAVPLPPTLPFAHPDVVHFLTALLFLWIFGDHVEARLGRVTLLLLYLVSSVAATYAASMFAPFLSPSQTAAAFAVTGVLGAYFLLLPQSRVLMLVPAPGLLTELPAWFLAAMWALLQIAGFARTPRSLPALLASLTIAFAIGALTALLARRPIRW